MGSSPLRVLVAEDDLEIRTAIARLLEHEGHRVRTVPNGRVLLDLFASWIAAGRIEAAADVLITDVQMPGVSGLEVIERLRHSRWSLPVIVITAFPSAEIRERARRAGAVAFFPKPFDPAELERTVSDVGGR